MSMPREWNEKPVTPASVRVSVATMRRTVITNPTDGLGWSYVVQRDAKHLLYVAKNLTKQEQKELYNALAEALCVQREHWKLQSPRWFNSVAYRREYTDKEIRKTVTRAARDGIVIEVLGHQFIK